MRGHDQSQRTDLQHCKGGPSLKASENKRLHSTWVWQIHTQLPSLLPTNLHRSMRGRLLPKQKYIYFINISYILIHIYVPVSTLSPPDQTSLFLPGENVLLLSTGSRHTSMTSCRAGEASTTERNSLQGLRAGRGYLKETAQQSSGTERLRRIHSNFRLSWQQLLWRTALCKEKSPRKQALQTGHLHQHIVPWLGSDQSLAARSILYLGIREDHLDVAVIPPTQLRCRALAGLKGGQGTLPAWQ